MSRRIRVYLTMSLADAEMLADYIEHGVATGEVELGHKNATQRFEKMHSRLVELTEAQRPSLVEGMVDGPPDDYDPDEGGS